MPDNLCGLCGGKALIVSEGERVCTRCGCAESIFVNHGSPFGSCEGVNPRSYDNGLGSEPLTTIREVRFESRMLVNTWQVVWGHYNRGHHNTFIENCMRDLASALDGVSDEAFLQCRRFLMGQVKRMSTSNFRLSRTKARRLVVQATLEEAGRTWPRVALMLAQRVARDSDGG
jgi:hypothetical protein